MEMTMKIYLEPQKSVPGCSILHYYPKAIHIILFLQNKITGKWVVVTQNIFQTFHKIYRKTPVTTPYFGKVTGCNYSTTLDVSFLILWDFSELLFYWTPANNFSVLPWTVFLHSTSKRFLVLNIILNLQCTVNDRLSAQDAYI